MRYYGSRSNNSLHCEYHEHPLYFLRLENNTEESADQPDYSKSTANDGADRCHELVELLALLRDRYGHGREVIAEPGLGDNIIRIFHDLRGLHQLIHQDVIGVLHFAAHDGLVGGHR